MLNESKYRRSDAQYADEKYTTTQFNYVWRILKIGKYKGEEVKRICYLNPDYIDWCKKNWTGFKLTKHEHFDYINGLKRKLEKYPDDLTLIEKIEYQECLYDFKNWLWSTIKQFSRMFTIFKVIPTQRVNTRVGRSV